jgi:Mrp family chromosome partitioning ATPase/uncharacterized protein involved in exopolysaccharide biosynthesis
MTDDTDLNPDAAGRDASLLRSARRHWWVVLLITAVFLIAGLWLAAAQQSQYEASASAIIRDARAPSASAVTDAGGLTNESSERHLADQVEILRSTAVAAEVVAVMGDGADVVGVSKSTRVVGELNSNLIVVTYTADSAEEAKLGADATVAAYVGLKEDATRESAVAAVRNLDTLIVNVDERLVAIQGSIDDFESELTDRAELQRQLGEAVAELNATRTARDAAEPGSEERTVLNARIDELLRDLAAWDAIIRLDEPDDQIAILVTSRDAAFDERATLVARRDVVALETDGSSSGVILFSAAELPSEPVGLPTELLLVLFGVLGLAMGMAGAYWMSLRKTRVTDRLEPENVLAAPMLVEIPTGGPGDRSSALPMLQAPDSDRAEAFRFMAAAITNQQRRVIVAGDIPARVLAFVSAVDGSVSASVTANTAIALAEAGHKVLVIDADIDRQSVSRLLELNRRPATGLVDVIESGAGLDEAIVRLYSIGGRDLGLGTGGSISALSRGSQTESSAYIMKQFGLFDVMQSVAEKFDVVIVDCPPLLSVAYTSTVVEAADASLAIVEHGQDLDVVHEFSDHLAATGTPLVGYVYDRSQTRSRRPLSAAAPVD